MKKYLLSYCIKFLLLMIGLFAFVPARAQQTRPDTVYTGVYITSIHDINFKDKEYAITMWLWLRYKNKKFDFLQNLEVPQAKSVTRSFSTVDSSNNQTFLMMKLQCVMKDSWSTENFPFDKQKLRFSIENSQFDRKALVFATDTAGKHFDPKFTLRGWYIDSMAITTGVKSYETAFGDQSLKKPHTEYSNYKVVMQIDRSAFGLFWKMFLGMYVAFLIAYMCFYIHADSIDSRFGLSVGALFAVVGNKYIIDSSLPESSSFTLVDTLHGITLLFILTVVTCTAYSLRLIKQDKMEQSRRFDFIAAQLLLGIYVVLNVWFIYGATRG
ncbi:ligand-gated ion channel [Mucilaginibacter koreensis]